MRKFFGLLAMLTLMVSVTLGFQPELTSPPTSVIHCPAPSLLRIWRQVHYLSLILEKACD